MDPYLGYCERPTAENSDAGKAPEPRILVKGTSPPEADEHKEETKTALPDSDGEDEAPEPPLVTVDNFLRVQCSLLKGKQKQTKYSRRTRRMKGGAAPAQSAASHVGELYDTIPLTSPVRSRRKANKRRKEGQQKFSERLRKAAALSHVDSEALNGLDHTNTIITPLITASYRTDDGPPSSPLPSKRAKLVDPHLSRRLDDSFTNKENNNILARSIKPFSQWNPHLSNFLAVPRATVTVKMDKHDYSFPRHANVTPLKLVPYNEHSASLSAKFGQCVLLLSSVNVTDIHNRKARRRMSQKAPIPQQEVAETDERTNGDDPFMIDDSPVLRDKTSQMNVPDSLGLSRHMSPLGDVADFDRSFNPSSPLKDQAAAEYTDFLLHQSSTETMPDVDNCCVSDISQLPETPGKAYSGAGDELEDAHISSPVHNVQTPRLARNNEPDDNSLAKLGSLLDSLVRSIGTNRAPSNKYNICTQARARRHPQRKSPHTGPIQSSPVVRRNEQHPTRQLVMNRRTHTVSEFLSDPITPRLAKRCQSFAAIKMHPELASMLNSTRHDHGLFFPLTQIPPPILTSEPVTNPRQHSTNSQSYSTQINNAAIPISTSVSECSGLEAYFPR